MDRIVSLQRRAAQYRQLASLMTMPDAKDNLLRLAEHSDRLAHDLDLEQLRTTPVNARGAIASKA